MPIPNTYLSAEARLKSEERKFKKHSDDELLIAIVLKYLIYEGKLDYFEFTQNMTDGPSDGGIDAMGILPNEETKKVAFIQCKRTQTISKETVIKELQKMNETLRNLSIDRSESIRNEVRELYFEFKDVHRNNNFQLVFCTTAAPRSSTKENIVKSISSHSEFKDDMPQLYFGDDIGSLIEEIDEQPQFVENYRLKFAKGCGILKYIEGKDSQNPNAIVVSVFASELKEMFRAYSGKGLFGQNLRTALKDNNVDNDIKYTIKKEPSEFWLKNNGVTIACQSFDDDGDVLCLKEMSVINGCQTLNNIGVSDFEEDFLVICKVIAEESFERRNEIAIAANKQKRIKWSDLRSNDEIQKGLQKKFMHATPSVALSIKRGNEQKEFLDRFKNKHSMADWRIVENEEYAQLRMSFHRQQPHIAFGGPSPLFREDSFYKEIFNLRQWDARVELDMLRIHGIFKEWRLEQLDKIREESVEKNRILNYGRFAILSSIAFLIKLQKGWFDLKKYDEASMEEKHEMRVEKNLCGPLFNWTYENEGVDELDEVTVERLKDLLSFVFSAHEAEINTRWQGRDVKGFYQNRSSYTGVVDQLRSLRVISPFEVLFKQGVSIISTK